ncbi:DNA (Cytosine-5)-methyltransferase DRM1/2 isoform 4 [Hibiscus syriacus]|uniref:DNA (Cytosine-5)-methyltransferase DRM1/2 isoform 4 n=1 Tax=Hibiscus syriacus TaxID=106335 RepID=A0A6A2Y608_HIBSY|nr:DNA (Cytosine-5)-methyltransferase DRM1/2 isoform 4 [Hibiscus syriacus]
MCLLNEVTIFCIWRDLVGQSSKNSLDDFTDIDSFSDIEEIMNSDSDEESKLLYLTKMGFSEAEASITMERYGSDSSIAELIDFICAAQMAKAADKKLEKKLLNEDDYAVHLPNPMIGSGVPTKSDQITQRTLPEDAIGPPYFYYKNVALALVDKGSVRLLKLLMTSHLRVSRRGGSVRDMFPGGINVLSLFSEISDAEVVFYCLGISLKTDVQELNGDQLEQLMGRIGEFNLVVDGIQCNNFTGTNKHHQDELEDFCCVFSCNDGYNNGLFCCSKIDISIFHSS